MIEAAEPELRFPEFNNALLETYIFDDLSLIHI